MSFEQGRQAEVVAFRPDEQHQFRPKPLQHIADLYGTDLPRDASLPRQHGQFRRDGESGPERSLASGGENPVRAGSIRPELLYRRLLVSRKGRPQPPEFPCGLVQRNAQSTRDRQRPNHPRQRRPLPAAPASGRK